MKENRKKDGIKILFPDVKKGKIKVNISNMRRRIYP